MKRWVGLVAVAVGACIPLIAYAAAGALDPSFGSSGIVLTDVGALDVATAVAVQPDGKIVAAGFSNSGVDAKFAVARYNSDGTLDATFGSGGVVTTAFGTRSFEEDFANAVAIQPNRKIVVAGGSNASGASRWALARYNSDGRLDTTFGSGGKVLTDVPGSSERAAAVALQPDGKIIAAGGGGDFAVARYNTDGTLDGSFGSSGIVVTDLGGFDFARAVAVQPTGKIVVAGTGGFDPRFAVARYNADGSLDSGFGSEGKATTDFDGNAASANAVAVQANGKVVASGEVSDRFSGVDSFALARYNSDGTLDTSFGSAGTVATSFGPRTLSFAYAVAVQADGRTVAAGYVYTSHGDDFAVARYDADGNLDATFGSGGTVMTDLTGTSSFDVAYGVAIQPQGGIVVAGSGNDNFAVARYLGR